MTPTEFLTAARNKYNAVGNSFYSDSELLILLYQMEMEMAKFALTIEATDSTISTVAGTREYTIPSTALAISRLTYDGEKLQKISFMEDDQVTSFDESDTDQGTPNYYEIWSTSIYLRPIPDAVKVLKFYMYKEPSIITVSDTIETPSRFHMDLVDGVVAEMIYKDENMAGGDRYRRRFESHLIEARKWQKKRRRSDAMAYVKDEANMRSNFLGRL